MIRSPILAGPGRNVLATVSSLAKSGSLKTREAAAVNDCMVTVGAFVTTTNVGVGPNFQVGYLYITDTKWSLRLNRIVEWSFTSIF